ncbi:MAG: hypothetical protein JF614_26490 [Acidobacteria bacterium]|nr:hypothetical protein [Acidobacteriota bacterium]
MLLFAFPVVGCRASEQPLPASTAQEAALGGEIQGILYADLGTGTENAIALPGLEVLLKPAGSERVIDKVSSDLHGRFVLPRQRQGSYRICWQGEGWVSQCLPEPLVLGEHGHYADLIVVKPNPRPGSGVLSGRITLADGTSPVFEDTFFAIKEIPQVHLEGDDRPIPVNIAGQFVIPGVPTTGPSLRVQLDRETLKPSLKTEALDFRGTTPVVLTSPNHRPLINSVTALLEGKPVGAVRPGQTVEVKARDKG